MHLLLILWLVVCVAGIALSMRSVAVLGTGSTYTRLGWAASAAYFVIAAVDATRGRPAPFHADDIALAVVVVAFVMAGIRDEAQAEPWWWPSRVGLTGRERRARK